MWKALSKLKKGQKKLIVYLNDIFCLGISFWIFINNFFINDFYFFALLFLIVLIYSIYMEFLGGFSEVLKSYTTDRLLVHAIPILLSSLIVFLAFSYEYSNGYRIFEDYLYLRYVAFALLAFVAASFTSITLTRIIAKLLIYGRNHDINARKVYIFGINDSARDLYSIYNEHSDYEIIGFITTDKNNQNRTLFGKKIISFKKALKLFKKDNSYNVFLALEKEESLKRPEIINQLSNLAITVKSIPSYSEYIEKDHLQLGELSAADILGREERSHDIQELDNFLNNKNILVTGSGGSIGSELARLLSRKKVNLMFVDSSEYNLYKLQEDFSRYKKVINASYKLADVRDHKRMDKIFKSFSPDIVFHAAAYKHVPIIEENNNFTEAVKTNIFGTLTVAKLAKKYESERFVFVSTDKAVRPTNLMGATKRIAERLIATICKDSLTIFSSVRFGNVLKSSGSVIPKFKDQIESGGPVTVTDKNMTRYFMTITEAAELVINASFLSSNYSTYLLKMGDPVRIYDLAKKMINLYGFDVKEGVEDSGIEIIFSGARPGEKIYEELLVSGNEKETDNKLIFRDETDSSLSNDDFIFLVEGLEQTLDNDNLNQFKELCISFADYNEPESN